MDFFRIKTSMVKIDKQDVVAISPDFIVGPSEDLMVRGGRFYAIWDEEKGIWSTSELDVARKVDDELRAFQKKMDYAPGESTLKLMSSFDSQSWVKFIKYLASLGNNYTPLDENITFADAKITKEDYVSKTLAYSLEDKDCPAWKELTSVLYAPEELAKIEFFIGSVVAGDSKRLQKFGVFYGDQGTGKGTILKIVHKLFYEYTSVFEAKALGQHNNAFATAAFENNPLVAIQYDGDLSRIEDNTKLNSIISHEDILVNQKYKASYMARINALLLMGTNQPVKISDSRSGIIRRLIDIHPTGNIVPATKYLVLMNQINFELGAIANHCLKVYKEMGFHYYDAYRPLEMMYKTDAFFNFVEANFDTFMEEDGISLKRAWSMYKEYATDAMLPYTLQMHKFKEELKSYFKVFEPRKVVNGQVMTSWYSGFDTSKFVAARAIPVETTEEVVVEVMSLDATDSLLDEELMHCPAQYGNRTGKGPLKYWSNTPVVNGKQIEVSDDKVCNTELSDLNTKKLHFVKVPANHIVIDFDLKGEDGSKSLEKNLAAASLWPPTYAELSQSGEGVHLHYNYVGPNLDRLALEFEPGIEIKVFRGDASLRRKLSKCNNTPVADISSGLPLKEKGKVLSADKIQSERHLRQMIVGNLHKKYVPGTYSSVSFIKKLLDEAYEEGVQYDVTDMRSDVYAFANNSTNKKMESLRLVQQMKFKGDPDKNPDLFGEDPSDISAERNDEKVALFDVEVYPDLFVVCWKYAGTPDESIVRMVNPSPEEVGQLFNLKLVGFYNRRYDNHMLYARYHGYNNLSLYNLSKAIIEEKKTNSTFGEAYGLSYADIWDFSAVKQSLKKFMIDLGIRKVEMDIPWDQPVAETAEQLGITVEELIERVLEYCCNDVIGTEAVWNARQADFRARQILAELSGLTVNDTTQKHTAKIVFGNDRNPHAKFIYTDLSEEFPGYDYDPTRKPDKSIYKGETVGEGGYVYAEPGMYEDVAVLDVASMHPTSIRVLKMFGEEYTKNFGDLVDARIAIKRKKYSDAEKLLDGKLKPYLGDPKEAKDLSYALKIVINIVYGLTSASFDNPFRDIRNRDNICAKRGALFMIELKHFVQERGFQVVHIKTDSIKIPHATPEIIEDVRKFGEKYGYDFEHEETYSNFALVDKAQYIARVGWHAEDPELVGTWEATGAEFAEPYVFKTMFSGEEVTYDDLAQVNQVTKGVMYLDTDYSKPEKVVDRMQFVGRIGRFVPVKEGAQGAGMLYRYQEEKFFAVTGTKGYLWMDAEMAREGVEQGKIEIDMSYYDKMVDGATKAIEKVADGRTIGDLIA